MLQPHTMSANNDTTSKGNADNKTEDELRRQLEASLSVLKKKEPLDTTYKRLLMSGTVTTRRPVLPKDKFYKRLGSNLRNRVETFQQRVYGKNYLDVIAQQRQTPIDAAKLQDALKLREPKEHEQQSLLDATLAAVPRRNNMDVLQRRVHNEAVAHCLQARERPAIPAAAAKPTTTSTAAQQTELARQNAELERTKAEARAREQARAERHEKDQQSRLDKIGNDATGSKSTPAQALHKLIQPLFQKLWDMEFAALGGTNPFRMIIDRDNCASIGAPDYFSIVDTPMNLTYIKRKVEKLEYESLSAFFQDVDLMLKNAVTYNSHPENPYRLAAEDMRKRYIKMAKKVVSTVQQQQQK